MLSWGLEKYLSYLRVATRRFWVDTWFCFTMLQQNHQPAAMRHNDSQDRNIVKWMSNMVPHGQDSSSKEVSAENSPSDTPTHQPDESRGLLSPQRPINLLPEVPIQTSRKLSEKEQRDCDVIGTTLPVLICFRSVWNYRFKSGQRLTNHVWIKLDSVKESNIGSWDPFHQRTVGLKFYQDYFS